MLEDNILSSTSDSLSYGGNKGKRGRDDQDRRGKRDFSDSSRTIHHNEINHSSGQSTEN